MNYPVLCPHCGNPNQPGSVACSRCGAPVPAPATFGNAALSPAAEGLGLMLLALLFVFDNLVWKLLVWFEFRHWDSPVMTVFSWLVALGMWAIMIIFTRNKTYRIVVIVAAALILGLRLWNEFMVSRVDPVYFEF